MYCLRRPAAARSDSVAGIQDVLALGVAELVLRCRAPGLRPAVGPDFALWRSPAVGPGRHAHLAAGPPGLLDPLAGFTTMRGADHSSAPAPQIARVFSQGRQGRHLRRGLLLAGPFLFPRFGPLAPFSQRLVAAFDRLALPVSRLLAGRPPGLHLLRIQTPPPAVFGQFRLVHAHRLHHGLELAPGSSALGRGVPVRRQAPLAARLAPPRVPRRLRAPFRSGQRLDGLVLPRQRLLQHRLSIFQPNISPCAPFRPLYCFRTVEQGQRIPILTEGESPRVPSCERLGLAHSVPSIGLTP